MARAAQTFPRLLTALEDLISQEEVLLRAADYLGVLATQERAAPLVDRLAGLAMHADLATRSRITALVARRTEGLELLAAEIERTRVELSEMQASQHRAARIAPVYGSLLTPMVGRLSAVG